MRQLAISDPGETATMRLEPTGSDNGWYGSYEAAMAFCTMSEQLSTQPGTKMEKELRSLERALQVDLRAVVADRNVNLIDLGTGDGQKMCLLVDALQAAGVRTVRYVPVDKNPFISRYAIVTLLRRGKRTWKREEVEQLVGPLDAPGEMRAGETLTTEMLVRRWPRGTGGDLVIHDGGVILPMSGLEIDFFADFPRVVSAARRLGDECLNVFCLLGNTLGNYPAEKREAFLARLSDGTAPGELFLLGVGLRPGESPCDPDELRQLQTDYLPGEAFMRLQADHPHSIYSSRYEPESYRMIHSFERPDGSRQVVGYSYLFDAQEVIRDLHAAGFEIVSCAIHPGEHEPRQPRYFTVLASRVGESTREAR